jgi:hypothetical protein
MSNSIYGWAPIRPQRYAKAKNLLHNDWKKMIMKNKLMLSAMLLCCGCVSHAEPPITNFSPANPLSTSIVTAWTVEPWSGDDKPYTAIRDQLYNKLKQGRDMTILVKQYRSTLEKKPYDPRLVFSLAYSTYQADGQNPAFAQAGGDVAAVEAITSIATTHTYEFARIRFLLTTRNDPRHLWKDVGARLLRRDPSDYAVQFAYVQVLDPGQYPHERQEGLAVFQKMKQEKPEYQGLLALESNFYFKIALGTKSQADEDSWIVISREYMATLPATDLRRLRCEKSIKLFQSGFTYWRSKHLSH